MDVSDGTVITWWHKHGHWFAVALKGPSSTMLVSPKTGMFCAEPSVKHLFEKQSLRFSWRSKPHNTSLRLPLSEPFPYPNPDNIIDPKERELRFPLEGRLARYQRRKYA